MLSKRTVRRDDVSRVTTALGILFLVWVCGGCLQGTSEATFLAEASEGETFCDGVWPVCAGQFAGCALDTDHYLSGKFPGSRKFIVETSPGDWEIEVLFFLGDRLSPGTETEVSWFEPGCAEEYRYQLSKDKIAGDLFEQAGRDQVFSVRRGVVDPGDHLIEFYSDATCRYKLRIALHKME